MDEINEMKNVGDISNDVDETNRDDKDSIEDSSDSLNTPEVRNDAIDESKEIVEKVKDKKNISIEKSKDDSNENCIEKSKENDNAKDNIDKLLDSALQDFDKKKPKKIKAKKEQGPKSQEDDLLNLFNKTGITNVSL